MGLTAMLQRFTQSDPGQWGPPIHLVRHTGLITDDQVARIAAACDTQLIRDVAPAHHIAPCRVLATASRDVPRGARTIRLIDDAGEDSFGWHTELTGDVVIGVVGVRTVLEHTGTVLDGPLSVSSVTSHEVVEMAVNAHVSMWADTGLGYLVAAEIADPVQSDSYEIGGVSLSNFVTGEWFSPINTPGDRFDHLGSLTEPFSINNGGYVLRLRGGEVTPVFGADFPDWVWAMKQRDASRTARLTVGRPS